MRREGKKHETRKPDRGDARKKPDKRLALLAAVASGDAALEDIAAELRREGIDSVSALLAMLREAVKNRRASEAAAKRIINLSHLTHKTPPDLVSGYRASSA